VAIVAVCSMCRQSGDVRAQVGEFDAGALAAVDLMIIGVNCSPTRLVIQRAG
jgi:hypothetical protein